MDEDIFIPFIVFSFILAMVWMILNYAKWRHQHKAEQPEGGSLRTSELKALMQEAVAEANAPLLEKIEALEEELRVEPAPRLIAMQEVRRLEVPDSPEHE